METTQSHMWFSKVTKWASSGLGERTKRIHRDNKNKHISARKQKYLKSYKHTH